MSTPQETARLQSLQSGTAQRWNPQRYAEHARYVSELGLPLVDLLTPTAGESILDLGCGDGTLTLELVRRGCRVVGVDASAEQVEAARSLGIEAYVMDGAQLPFQERFDAVFSNAALHWMPAPVAVLRGVWNALKPGGRFVAECGAQGNIQTIQRALRKAMARRHLDYDAYIPWYFPAAAEYRQLLEAQGFRVPSLAVFSRPTPLPGDLHGFLETFAGAFLAALAAHDRPAFLDEVQAVLAPELRDPSGRWIADYVRLRLRAEKAVREDEKELS